MSFRNAFGRTSGIRGTKLSEPFLLPFQIRVKEMPITPEQRDEIVRMLREGMSVAALQRYTGRSRASIAAIRNAFKIPRWKYEAPYLAQVDVMKFRCPLCRQMSNKKVAEDDKLCYLCIWQMYSKEYLKRKSKGSPESGDILGFRGNQKSKGI